MAIEFEHGGNRFRVDTPEEASALLAYLDLREHWKPRVLDPEARRIYQAAVVSKLRPARPEDANPWTPEVFAAFISRLGRPQKAVLQALLLHRRISDKDLRDVLGIVKNQALAGVLSGISKQALAIKVTPRAVFFVENTRSGGKRSSVYEVADYFRHMAYDVGWPTLEEIIQKTLDNA